MGWPPGWGHHYWFARHAASKVYQLRATPMTMEELEHCQDYIKSSCVYLPCPGCAKHCIANTAANTPTFENADEMARYFHQFHNIVNALTFKLTVSEAEAETQLAANLNDRRPGATLQNLPSIFMFDYWLPLIQATFWINEHHAESVAKGLTVPIAEFFHHAIYMLPFAIDHPDVRQKLLDCLPEMDTSTTMKALEGVVLMYNRVCASFGEAPLESVQEIYQRTHRAVSPNPELIRAHQIRVEDHRKLMDLQKELHQLKLGNSTANAETSSAAANGWKIATIILSVLLSLCVLVMAVSYMVVRMGGQVPFCPAPQPKFPTKTDAFPYGEKLSGGTHAQIRRP